MLFVEQLTSLTSYPLQVNAACAAAALQCELSHRVLLFSL